MLLFRGDLGKDYYKDGANVQENCTLHVFPNIETIWKRISTYRAWRNYPFGHIGRNCLVGMNAVVMDKAVIGDECIIGA